MSQQRLQNPGISFQRFHHCFAHKGFSVLVQQLLSQQALLVSTASRATAAEFISGLEGAAAFHPLSLPEMHDKLSIFVRKRNRHRGSLRTNGSILVSSSC